MDPAAESALIRLLQRAHAGELAASLAYTGHARSVRDEGERADLLRIRDEELDHRERVGRLLARMGAAPCPSLERRLRRIGTLIAALCRVGGWYVPMYGAGRLEAGNVLEYEEAADLARRSDHAEFVDDLLDMARVEREHEAYFRDKVLGHWARRVLPVWSAPRAAPPTETRCGGSPHASRRSATVAPDARGLAD